MLRPITVAAPKVISAGAAATTYFRNPEVENPGFPQTGYIADGMDDRRSRDRPKGACDQENLGRDNQIYDKVAIGNAGKHLRLC